MCGGGVQVPADLPGRRECQQRMHISSTLCLIEFRSFCGIVNKYRVFCSRRPIIFIELLQSLSNVQFVLACEEVCVLIRKVDNHALRLRIFSSNFQGYFDLIVISRRTGRMVQDHRLWRNVSGAFCLAFHVKCTQLVWFRKICNFLILPTADGYGWVSVTIFDGKH